MVIEINTTEKRSRKLKWFLVTILFIVVVQGYLVITRLSITYDERAYIATGYARLITGDKELGIGSNPPFTKYIISLPFFFRKANVPVNSDAFDSGYDFTFGNEVLFYSGNDFIDIIVWGRLMVLVLSLIQAYFIYSWARLLFGPKSGILALFIYAFEPNIIAHSNLATLDFGVTVFSFLSVYFAWRYFKTSSILYVVTTGSCLAFALGSKYTAILVVPVICLIAILSKTKDCNWITNGQNVNRWLALGLIYGMAFLVLWGIYGFQLEPLSIPKDLEIRTDQTAILSRELLPKYFSYFRGISLPAPGWVTGLLEQFIHSKAGHPSYLCGNYSEHGWWYYYPIAFLIKTPIPLLIMVAVGLWLMFKELTDRRDRLVLLLLPTTMMLLSLANTVDSGLRNILPIYPFLIVFASQLAAYRFININLQRCIVGLFCIWLAISSLLVFPEHLAYFNEFVGGPSNGHKYLLDSNLDWGQGLIQVKNYMEKNKIGAVKFAYFGTVDPAFYGIALKEISPWESLVPQRELYLVSASRLYDTYMNHQAWAWARKMEPSDRIGYSVFVYDLRN